MSIAAPFNRERFFCQVFADSEWSRADVGVAERSEILLGTPAYSRGSLLLQEAKRVRRVSPWFG